MANNNEGIYKKIMNQSVIKKGITLFCFCIGFILFWIIFAINAYAIRALPWNEPYQNMTQAFFYISIPIIVICVLLLPFLSGLFLMMYMVFKPIDSAGFGGLLTGIIPPFGEANDAGLFRFFEKLEKASGLKTNRGRAAMNATDDFLTTFIQNLFGSSIDSQVNQDFITSITELLKYGKDGVSIDDEKKKALTKIISESIPILVIPPKDEPPSESQIKEAEACIAKNIKHVPNDIGTIEQLRMIYANSVIENNCRITHSNKEDKTLAKNHWDNIHSAATTVASVFADTVDEVKKYKFSEF